MISKPKELEIRLLKEFQEEILGRKSKKLMEFLS
jgi:hypothetical protein